VELVQAEQELLLAVAEAEQVTQALAQMLLQTMAVMVAQAVVVVAVPQQQVLLAQVATELFFYTTKEF